MKTTVVIPCHNEGKFIRPVVLFLKKYPVQVMVIDNNSGDDTVSKAVAAGADIVYNPIAGYGATLSRGIHQALAEDADIIVTIDGDGQHDARDLERVLAPILQGKADLVIGSRFIGKALEENQERIPKSRMKGIRMITLLFNLFSLVTISDAQSGFRAYRRQVLSTMPLEEAGMNFSVETLVKARDSGVRITEVPITVHYHRDFSDNSSLNPFRHGIQVALAVVKWRFKIEFLPLFTFGTRNRRLVKSI